MKINDRRNPSTRGATVKCLMERLRATPDGVELDDLRDAMPSPDVAIRILRRLALRGLVWIREGRWAPRPVLLAGCALQLDNTFEEEPALIVNDRYRHGAPSATPR